MQSKLLSPHGKWFYLLWLKWFHLGFCQTCRRQPWRRPIRPGEAYQPWWWSRFNNWNLLQANQLCIIRLCIWQEELLSLLLSFLATTALLLMGNLKVIISCRNGKGLELLSRFPGISNGSPFRLLSRSGLSLTTHCIGYNCNIVLACTVQYVIHTTTIEGNDRSPPKEKKLLLSVSLGTWSLNTMKSSRKLDKPWLPGCVVTLLERGKVLLLSVTDRQLCHFIKFSHSEFGWDSHSFSV